MIQALLHQGMVSSNWQKKNQGPGNSRKNLTSSEIAEARNPQELM